MRHTFTRVYTSLDCIQLSPKPFAILSLPPAMCTMFVIPMPTPGFLHVPPFRGQPITDFLDSLEAHATTANVPLDDLQAYVLHYCHRRVHNIVDSSIHWTQHDWSAARSYLFDLYGSNDRRPKITPNRLQSWVKLHAETGSISSFQDVDRYYQEFTAQSTTLLDTSFITVNEANLLFYKGILSPMCKKIRRKIPDANQTATLTPSITSVLGFLRDEFNMDDIDGGYNMDFNLYADLDLSDIDDDIEPPIKHPRVSRNKITKRVSIGPTTNPQVPLPLDGSRYSSTRRTTSHQG